MSAKTRNAPLLPDERPRRRVEVLTGHLPHMHSWVGGDISLATGGGTPSLATVPCGRGMRARTPRAFDISDMEEFLNSDNREVRKKLMAIVKASPLFKHSYNIPYEEYREKTLEKAKFLADQKLLKLSDMRDNPQKHLACAEVCAFVDPSLTVKLFGVQWGLFGASILLLGTERHAHLHERARSLEMPGAFAMTELYHGSNVRGLQTTATYNKEKSVFVIRTPTEFDQKFWLGNAAAHGTHCVVFARLLVDGTDHGVHAFIAPLRDPKTMQTVPGVRIADCGSKLGLQGVDNGRIWFDGLEIPRENLLNRFANVREDGTYHSIIENPGKRFFTTIGALVLGRVLVATCSVVGAKQALTIAIRYTDQRKQFGDPKSDEEQCLLDYPAMQRRLLPLLATTFAHHFAVAKLKKDLQNATQKNADMIETLANGFKALCSWHMSRTQQECREACGGQGFGLINRIGFAKSDADINLTYEGDNNVLLQQVAKTLLEEFQGHFEGYQEILEFIGHNLGKSIRERNPIVTRIRSEAHLLSVEFQQNAFEYREEKAVRKLAKRFMRGNADKQPMFKVWCDSFAEINQVAIAHIERNILDAFIEAIEECPEPTLVPVLKSMRSLYALSTIEKDLGWFMTHKYLSPIKAKAIGHLVTALCSALRDNAVPLVRSFGLDDELLGAPIAVNWPDHFKWENRHNHW